MAEGPRIPDYLPSALKRWIKSMAPERQVRALEALKDVRKHEFLREWIKSNPQSQMGNDLSQKLIKGAANVMLGASFDEVLDPGKVGQFLAWLANSKERHISSNVKLGLEWLGIPRIKRKGGRPRGSTTDTEYSLYLEFLERRVRETGVWKEREKLIRKYPRSWRSHFEALLRRNRWDPELVHTATTSRTLHSFAISATSLKYRVSYDAVARAYRRCKSKAAKTYQ